MKADRGRLDDGVYLDGGRRVGIEWWESGGYILELFVSNAKSLFEVIGV